MTQPSPTVTDAITTRRSIRAFLPTPVPQAQVAEILALAARAPSGSNIQPWQVIALSGAALSAFGQVLSAHVLAGEKPAPEYHYYPRNWREPYLARRRKVGWDLYASLGIQRGEDEKMMRQNARNFVFFDAPVGLIFTIDRDMELGSWLDYGMFLQSIMLAARGFGLDTCPIAAFASYPALIARQLQIPADRQVICGMALGHADPGAPENRFMTERAPLADFTRFIGF